MNRLSTEIFKDWLQPRLLQKYPKLPLVTGRIPDMPDRVVLLTPSGQGEILNEGIFERQLFRFQTRGNSNNQNDAEAIAYEIYRICDGLENFDITDEIYVVSMKGNARPRQMEITDSQSRYRFISEIEVVSSID
jgi:hypothetical protein